MSKSDIEISGMKRYDSSDAYACGEYDKRLLIQAALEHIEMPRTLECTFATTGDTLIMVTKDPKTGQREVWDLQVRCHYVDQPK